MCASVISNQGSLNELNYFTDKTNNGSIWRY